MIKIIGYCSLVLFVLLSISIFIYPQAITYTTLCFCAIPAMYGLSMILSISKIIKKTIINISKNCFHIYLVHMFFIQGIALIFMWLYPFKIESIGFMTFYIICSTTFSILGSIIVFRITDRIKVKIY